MLETLQRPASGSFEVLGGSPVHLDRLRSVNTAELDSAPDARSTIAIAALATSLYPAACATSQQPNLQRFDLIPYVSQASSWDCGLACVAMCLGAFRLESPSLMAFHKLYPNRSVWTIDLAHLLRRFGLQVKYYTLTLGINPGFFLESFYEQMEADAVRIQQLFQEAEGQGILISQTSVPDSEIWTFLEDKLHFIIALVDKDLLEAGLFLWKEGYGDSVESCRPYTGHYVVICSYDRESDHYIIMDPDPRSRGFDCIARILFNAARQAFGTDEDLLMVSAGRGL